MNHEIAYLSYNDCDVELKARSTEILNAFFEERSYTFSSNEGQILFIASGGSEQNAEKITNKHQNITLLCHRESNSFAAAIEIAAFLRSQNKRVSLIDVLDPLNFSKFEEIQTINRVLGTLSKQKAALIGEVSDWLIISDVEKDLVKERLGIELLHLPWSELPDYKEKESSVEFLGYFPGVNPEKLKDTAKVYSLLNEVIEQNQLSAMSVECFSMVVRDKVTACLPLAVINHGNKVAACEGDICSMLGMMLIRALANQVPWQANIAELKEETVLLAHCTAPLNMLKTFAITTHFETNSGTAIRGKLEKQEIGIFRVNNTLDKYTLVEGDIKNTPDYDFACRTQIEVQIGYKQVQLLRDKSLGNHQLIFHSKYIPLLKRMMEVLAIEQIV